MNYKIPSKPSFEYLRITSKKIYGSVDITKIF